MKVIPMTVISLGVTSYTLILPERERSSSWTKLTVVMDADHCGSSICLDSSLHSSVALRVLGCISLGFV